MMGVNIIFLVGVFVILLIGVVAAVLAVCLKKVNAQERPEEMPDQQARQDFQNHQWMTEEQNRIIQEQNRIIQEQVQQQINQDHMRNM